MMPGAPSEVTRSGSEAAHLHVLEEGRHRLGIFLRSRHHVQQHPAALDRKAPGRQNRFALGARPQTLGNAVDKQITNHVLAQIPLSSPHRTHAAQALCELLDKMTTIFPGFSPALSLRNAPAAAYRACLPRLSGRARNHGRRPGALIGAETGQSCATLCQEL